MLKIILCMRHGRIANIGLERFVEALQDPGTDLTYPALTGERKQSVENVERLFSFKVIAFMERNNYKYPRPDF